MVDGKDDSDKVEFPQDEDSLAEFLQMQVSGIPSDKIPGWRRLKSGSIEGGLKKFLRKYPNSFKAK